MKKQNIFLLFSLLILLFFLPSKSHATTLSIENLPSSIDESEEFEVQLTLSCSGCSDSYLRGVFYPSGTSYFGYTQDNSGNWSNSSASGCQTYYKVAQSDLAEGNWSGTLKVKLDKESSYYKGGGEYSFKVGRYTSSCRSATWSNEVKIAVSGPTPTPSLVPTSTLSPSPTKTTTSNKTPVPIKTPTPSKNPTPTKTIALANAGSESSEKSKKSVTIAQNFKIATDFARLRNITVTPKRKEKNVEVLAAKDQNFSGLIILGGAVLLLAGCMWFVLKNYNISEIYEKIFNK